MSQDPPHWRPPTGDPQFPGPPPPAPGFGPAPGQPPGQPSEQVPPPGFGPPRGPAPPPPPPYGGRPPYPQGPSSWQQLPPEDLIRMHQPGIIPLRPLTLGDIFDGSLKTMRRNPEATIGLALIVLTLFLVPSLLVSLAVTRLSTLAVVDTVAITQAVPGLFTSLASLALSGFVIYVVSEAALGDKAGIGDTWRAVRGRLLALVGVTALTTLIVIGIAALAVLVVVLLLQGGSEAGLAAGVLAMLGLVPLLLWLAARLSLAPAAVVLESAGPGRGISRSWRLTSGKAAWRVLGITLLAGLLGTIFSTAVAVPINALAGALLDLTPGTASQLGLLTVSDHVVQLIVNAVVTPFTAGVIALLYLDYRIRREALDLTLSRAAQERAAARRV